MTRRIRVSIVVSVCLLGACGGGSSHHQSTPSTPSTRPPAPSTIGTIADRAWIDVAVGTFRSQTWTISYGRTTEDWRCYDPQGAAQRVAPPNLGTGRRGATPAHLGRPSQCLAPRPATGSVRFSALLAGADADQWVLIGAVADGVTRAQLVFGDRTSTLLNVDPHTRLIEWKGPASLRPAQIRTDATACALDPQQKPAGATLCDGVATP